MSHLIRKLKEDSIPSPSRLWYNDWVSKNAKGRVLDVGKSRFWDYGFHTIDINAALEPTFVGNIEKTSFPDNMYDTILCNGMYECVNDQQKMVDEIWRILKTGGVAIFGFVGANYKPYKNKKDWKFYEIGKINFKKFKIVEMKDINTTNSVVLKDYHFIVCQK